MHSQISCRFLKTTPFTSFVLFSILIFITGCTKERSMYGNYDSAYTSLADFYNRNQVPTQTFIVNASTGGNFTTPQGTIISIPPGCFTDNAGNPVPGNVSVEFKDIYRKSDMLLSHIPTSSYGWPLKSAGEFFIRARSGGVAVNIAPTKKIEVTQPSAEPVDTMMIAFIGVMDTVFNWRTDSAAFSSLSYSMTNYIFSLYKFSNPVDSGTWCNSDNPYFFSGYPLTGLTIRCDADTGIYNTNVFLVFEDINSMVEVYRSYLGKDFTYQYAPEGLKCTIVAVAVMAGKFYGSFTPITIGSNQTVEFSLTEMTTNEFKAKLDLLNN